MERVHGGGTKGYEVVEELHGTHDPHFFPRPVVARRRRRKALALLHGRSDHLRHCGNVLCQRGKRQRKGKGKGKCTLVGGSSPVIRFLPRPQMDELVLTALEQIALDGLSGATPCRKRCSKTQDQSASMNFKGGASLKERPILLWWRVPNKNQGVGCGRCGAT